MSQQRVLNVFFCELDLPVSTKYDGGTPVFHYVPEKGTEYIQSIDHIIILSPGLSFTSFAYLRLDVSEPSLHMRRL